MSDGDPTGQTGTPPTHADATEGNDGYWRNERGEPLNVSASDLERFTYCPLSWHLAATGHAGKVRPLTKENNVTWKFTNPCKPWRRIASKHNETS